MKRIYLLFILITPLLSTQCAKTNDDPNGKTDFDTSAEIIVTGDMNKTYNGVSHFNLATSGTLYHIIMYDGISGTSEFVLDLKCFLSDSKIVKTEKYEIGEFPEPNTTDIFKTELRIYDKDKSTYDVFSADEGSITFSKSDETDATGSFEFSASTNDGRKINATGNFEAKNNF